MALSPPSECGVRPGGGGRRSQRSGSTVLAQVGTTLSAEALVLQMESISTTNGTECFIIHDHAASSDEWEEGEEEEEEEGREEDGKL